MEREEICCFCGRVDRASQLGVWFVNSERHSVHTDCWLAAYRPDADRSPALARAPAGAAR